MLLTATPAHAAESLRGDHRMPRALAGVDGNTALATSPVSVRVPASTTPSTYTVQPGDTVTAIAAQHGLRTVDVLAINGFSWSTVIYPGQVLLLAAPSEALVAPVEPVAPPSPAPPAGSYVVVGGDTISAIARSHGVSTQAVLDANGLIAASIIYPGQSIAIPGASAPVSEAAAPPAETAVPSAPPPSAGLYVVAAGDTISAIAQSHGVSTQSVLDANGLTGASIIYPGQSIAVPDAAPLVLAAAVAPAPAPAASTTLDAEQIASAKTIIAVGRELGVPERGIAIALGTAMKESWLRNFDWGDRDSLGLFQQRPSTGWGTEAEVSDPVRAARAFYGGPADPNGSITRGLLDIGGWENLPFADAAQAVQISAYPERYAQWEQPAYAWLAAHG
jgi:LysM repeat protein